MYMMFTTYNCFRCEKKTPEISSIDRRDTPGDLSGIVSHSV